MRLPSFCHCPSQPMLTLVSLALLIPIPGAVTYPRFPTSLLPTLASPDWETALLQLQAALDVPREVGRLRQPNPGDALWPEDPRLRQLLQGLAPAQDGGGWGRGAILRGQRGGLVAWPLSPFPGGDSLESLHYQEGGEEEGEGGKRNEALTSIAGGLQAFSREKGGFGFRFGRK